MSYGSEFQPVEQLDEFLGKHPNSAHFLLSKVKYAATQLPEGKHHELLERTSAKGDHPSMIPPVATPMMECLMLEDRKLSCGLPLMMDTMCPMTLDKL